MEDNVNDERVAWLDRPMTFERGQLIAFLCLALSWKFDGSWGVFFVFAFFGLSLWMLFGPR